MIHVPTILGGWVDYQVRTGEVVSRGAVVARVRPPEGPTEELLAPCDGVVSLQRLRGRQAPPHALLVGLRRVVLATAAGRVRWVLAMGPVGPTTLVAPVDTDEGTLRPHRAGAIGFVGEGFVTPGGRVEAGRPLMEIRGEDLG